MTTSDPARFSGALAGVTYPARAWQLWAQAQAQAQADAYGADAQTCEQLSRLPAATYANLDAVITQLRDTHPIYIRE
jgi:hypothetical protein